MGEQREKALELGKIKSVREQSKIRVYEDTNTENEDYLVSPKNLNNRSDLILIDTFDSSIDGDEESDLVEIKDPSNIEEGDQVIINEDQSDQVIRVTERQIVTLSGDKFRRSDGKLWGKGESKKMITHKALV